MECVEIKALLSEFMDDMLDAQTRAAVEAHVSTCRECTEELASLRALVKALGALEPIQAPDDFLEKVHERMTPRRGFYRILRKLFVPLHIKIPLELAGVATMALLVLLVLNVQQSDKGIVQRLKSSSDKINVDTDTAGSVKSNYRQESKGVGPLFEAETVRKPRSVDGMIPPETVEKSVAEPKAKRKFELTPSVIQQTPIVPPVISREPVELELVIKTGIAGSAHSPAVPQEKTQPLEKSSRFGGGAAEDLASSDIKTSDQQAEAVEGRINLPLTEKKEALLLSARERPLLKDETGPELLFAENPLNAVQHLVARVAGKVVSVEYHGDTDQLKIIHTEIPIQHYSWFCTELSRMAELLNPPSAPLGMSPDTLRIRIRFEAPD